MQPINQFQHTHSQYICFL